MLIGLAILAGHVAVFAVALIAPVAVVALLCGLGPGLVAALTGPFAFMWYVNPPGSVATGQTTPQTAELGLLMLVSVSVAVIVGRSEAARRRSDAENARSWRRRSRRVPSVGRTYPPSPWGRGSQTRARPRLYT